MWPKSIVTCHSYMEYRSQDPAKINTMSHTYGIISFLESTTFIINFIYTVRVKPHASIVNAGNLLKKLTIYKCMEILRPRILAAIKNMDDMDCDLSMDLVEFSETFSETKCFERLEAEIYAKTANVKEWTKIINKIMRQNTTYVAKKTQDTIFDMLGDYVDLSNIMLDMRKEIIHVAGDTMRLFENRIYDLFTDLYLVDDGPERTRLAQRAYEMISEMVMAEEKYYDLIAANSKHYIDKTIEITWKVINLLGGVCEKSYEFADSFRQGMYEKNNPIYARMGLENYRSAMVDMLGVITAEPDNDEILAALRSRMSDKRKDFDDSRHAFFLVSNSI